MICICFDRNLKSLQNQAVYKHERKVTAIFKRAFSDLQRSMTLKIFRGKTSGPYFPSASFTRRSSLLPIFEPLCSPCLQCLSTSNENKTLIVVDFYIYAWKGTSRENLYNELVWESLNLRLWRRRLTFYKKSTI